MGAWKTNKSGNVIGDFKILERLDTGHYLVECVHCGEMVKKTGQTLTRGKMRCSCQKNRIKVCRYCKKEFETDRNAVFCSKECSNAYYRDKPKQKDGWKKNLKRTVTETTRMLICVYSAEGETEERIAKALNRTVKTVKNILTVCKKNGKYAFYVENSPIIQARLRKKRG